MFSKEWLDNCSCSITSYETPAKVVDNDSDEIEETEEKEKKMDIQKMLRSMKKRRGEE